MLISAVVWDVDDTLFDYSAAERGGALAHLAAEGLLARYADEDAAAAHWRQVMEEQYGRFLCGELDFQGQRRARARSVTGRQLADAEADAWFGRYQSCSQRHWRIFPDVIPALDALAPRFRHGVLSNSGRAHQEHKLQVLGLRERFEAVVCSGDLGVAKPAAAAFHAACAALELPPERVAYVGDRPDTDAAGADAAGLTGIWLDRNGQTDRNGRADRADRNGQGGPTGRARGSGGADRFDEASGGADERAAANRFRHRVTTLAELPALLSRLAR